MPNIYISQLSSQHVINDSQLNGDYQFWKAISETKCPTRTSTTSQCATSSPRNSQHTVLLLNHYYITTRIKFPKMIVTEYLLKILTMAEGSRMWAIFLLTMMLVFPFLSAAPLNIAGDIKDDNDGMHSHDENVTRGGKFFGHSQVDIGKINIYGAVEGDVNIDVNIDVHGHNRDHNHHEDDTECEEGLSVLFKSIDSNKNGIVDAKELLMVCHQNNIQITESLAVRMLTQPDKTVEFNMAKFCELLKNCPSTKSADIIYFLLKLYDEGISTATIRTTTSTTATGAWRQKNEADCWYKCGSKDGSCPTFCGVGGFCCRKGYAGCPAGAPEASPKYHTCVIQIGTTTTVAATTTATSSTTTITTPTKTGDGVNNCFSAEGCPLIQNNLITTSLELKKEFQISFEFQPVQYIAGWQNVLHMTTGQNTDRKVALWVKNDGQLHLWFTAKSILTEQYATGQWHSVEFSQRLEGTQYIYRVKINGVKVVEVVNSEPNIFSNVKVYASDPWHNALKGTLRNLVINMEKTEVAGCSRDEIEKLCWCPRDYSPVCAGGRLYNNLCLHECAKKEAECADLQAIPPVGDIAECVDPSTKVSGCSRDEIEKLCWCPRDYLPVCAGGRLYNNLCLHECAKKEAECADVPEIPAVGDIAECVDPSTKGIVNRDAIKEFKMTLLDIENELANLVNSRRKRDGLAFTEEQLLLLNSIVKGSVYLYIECSSDDGQCHVEKIKGFIEESKSSFTAVKEAGRVSSGFLEDFILERGKFDKIADVAGKVQEKTAVKRPPQGIIVDGGWSAWSSWSDCTGTCGEETRMRTRACSSPAGGKSCPGAATEAESCGLNSCEEKLWRDDGRCGESYPLRNGHPGQCDPNGVHPCCSNKGWCGKTDAHCKCSSCINYADICQNGNGEDYNGIVRKTTSGLYCQKWTSQSPHSHDWESLGNHNYCRNPDGEPGVWCYTTNHDKRWELCDVQVCNEGEGEGGGPTFLIVALDHVLAESFDDIEKAKAKLMEVTTRSRLIAEVDSSGNLKRDPHEVGGQNQGGDIAAGFNKYWDDWHDINRMMDVAQRFLDGNTGGEVLELNAQNFDGVVSSYSYVLVLFYSPWCGYCKQLFPEYDAAAKILAEKPIGSYTKMAKIDNTVHKALGRKYKISAYPTLKLFYNGQESAKYSGARNANAIVDWLAGKSTITSPQEGRCDPCRYGRCDMWVDGRCHKYGGGQAGFHCVLPDSKCPFSCAGSCWKWGNTLLYTEKKDKCANANANQEYVPKNGNWNLLFRQTINGIDELFKKNEWTRNKENVDAPNYSILGDFEKFRKPDGSFHLFLWYPELGTGNEWVQTSNPVTKTSGGVDNYKGILTPYTGYAWGGLEHNNGAALLDGSLDSGLWWYAIGSTTDYSGGIPGPKDDKAHHVVKKVELYINYQDFCFEYDIHHVGLGLLRKQGGDNNYGGTGSARDCQLLCQQTDGCQWFNWLKAEDECWLKSGKGDQTQDRPGGVTGPRTCPPVVAETGDGWTFMPSTVTSLTTIEVNDHTKCCAKCKEVAPDTQMYNFNKKEKKCYCIKPHPGVTPSTEQKSDTVGQFCTGKPNGCFVKGECNNKKQDWSVERWDTWGCENLNSCTDKDACQGRPKTLFEFCENNEDQPFISRFIKDEVEIMFIFPEGATMFDYCSISTDHMMCKYSGPSTTCKANTIKRDLSDVDKQAIVKKHNELRGKVANGLEKRGQPGPQPAASDMLLMVWDDELATIAQRWADQCTYEHDTKRNMKGDTNGHVGQNVYIRYSTAEMTDADLFDSCVLATTKWYEEVKDFDKDNVNSFKPSSSDSVTGHYTQVVWGSSRAVGCGSVYYKASPPDYPYHHLVICNYFKGGNIIDGAMYSPGTACSACPSGYPTCSDGLCN